MGMRNVSAGFLRIAIPAVFIGASWPALAAPAPYRFELSPDFPPLVVQLDQGRITEAEDATPGFDLAWELMNEDSRALVVALADFVNAPSIGAERRRQRNLIAAAYVARDYRSFWRDGEGWNAAALAVARRLREAGQDGLDLGSARIPAIGAGEASPADELALSEAVSIYVAQAGGARIDPRRLSRLIGARPDLPETGPALASVAEAGAGAGERLREFNPVHPGYLALRDKLAELRSRRALDELSPVAQAMAEGSRSDETPAKRRRAPREKLSMSHIEAEIVANMERWRWLPRDLGENHVEVNIPEFELSVVRDGAVAHRARVIVGKEQTPTPIFSNQVQFIIVNPYWNVPASIINKEMLPKSGGDVSALERRGFKVSYRQGKLVVRQPPGEANALGRIKFMFPNDFAVYMHDTPSRGLFSAAHRAFSHGCMRVEDPFSLAEAVLGPGSGWSEARVRRLVGGSERYINLAKPMPIHIEYFTAYVDENGELKLRDDLYGYSARVRAALGLKG